MNMKLVITSAPKLRKEIELEYDANAVYDTLNARLESIETQLNVSIDIIKNGDVVELLCDSQINPMLFSFIGDIAKHELKKLALA